MSQIINDQELNQGIQNLEKDLKALRQCAYCAKLESEGQGLRLCGGCKMARYCNKFCQESGWKLHKQACIWNQESKRIYPNRESRQDLHKWVSSYGPSLLWLAVQGLHLHTTPSNANSQVLMITVERVPGVHAHPVTSFKLTTYSVQSWACLGDCKKIYLKHAAEVQSAGGVGVALMAFVFEKEQAVYLDSHLLKSEATLRNFIPYEDWFQKWCQRGQNGFEFSITNMFVNPGI